MPFQNDLQCIQDKLKAFSGNQSHEHALGCTRLYTIKNYVDSIPEFEESKVR